MNSITNIECPFGNFTKVIAGAPDQGFIGAVYEHIFIIKAYRSVQKRKFMIETSCEL